MVLEGCMMFENTSFEQLCRICSEKGEGTRTNVFSEDGVSNNLASKMKKYLDIQVSASIPKLVHLSTKFDENLPFVLSFVANYIFVVMMVYLLLFLLKRLCQP